MLIDWVCEESIWRWQSWSASGGITMWFQGLQSSKVLAIGSAEEPLSEWLCRVAVASWLITQWLWAKGTVHTSGDCFILKSPLYTEIIFGDFIVSDNTLDKINEISLFKDWHYLSTERFHPSSLCSCYHMLKHASECFHPNHFVSHRDLPIVTSRTKRPITSLLKSNRQTHTHNGTGIIRVCI